MVIAKDLMENKFYTINGNEPISNALSLFEKTDTLVLTEDINYQGILVKRELMRAKLSLNAKVHTFMIHPPKLSVMDPLEEIARLMDESGIYQLPVFENSKLQGVVKADNVLRYFKEYGPIDQPIVTFMTSKMTTLSPNDSIGKAIKLFKEQDISHLPVIEKSKIIGLLTMNNIIDRVMHPEHKPDKWGEFGAYITIEKHKMQLPVKGIMHEEPTLMSPETPLTKVVDHMLKYNLKGVLVGKNEQLHGIVTKKDLLKSIAGCIRKEENIEIRFDKRIDEIQNFDREEAKNSLKDELVKKYEEFLREGYIYVSMKQHKERKRGLPLITCQIRLSTFREMMYATDEGYGFMQAFKNTVNALEHQIRKIKRDKKVDYSQRK